MLKSLKNNNMENSLHEQDNSEHQVNTDIGHLDDDEYEGEDEGEDDCEDEDEDENENEGQDKQVNTKYGGAIAEE
jgi:endonuclease I